MSIETQIAELIEALRENTAALKAAGTEPAKRATRTVKEPVTVEAIATVVHVNEPVATVSPPAPEPTPTAAPILNYATDVRPKLIAYAAKHGRANMMELLATFGTESAADYAQTCTAAELVALHDAVAAGL